MKQADLARIWRQQKYNNSCMWDSVSMLLASKNIATNTTEIVGKSIIPYLMHWHSDSKSISAGMLVQDDLAINSVLHQFEYQLVSKSFAKPKSFISHAKNTLAKGDCFMTSIKPGEDFTGRHAIVVVDFSNNYFIALNPDTALDRNKDYDFSEVKNKVVLKFSENELIRAVARDDGKKPVIGQLNNFATTNSTSATLKEMLERSQEAFQYYKSESAQLDFGESGAINIVFSIIKPIILDLRIAIEIRDKKINRKSEFAGFLKDFEAEFLTFYKKRKDQEFISKELIRKLNQRLEASYDFLEEHISGMSSY